MARPVLLIHSGRTLSQLERHFGDFDRWFMRALEGSAIAWTVVRPFEQEALPDPGGFAAVLMTGAHASVRDLEPWMEDTARWVRRAVEGGTPFLGVCFGHQLLAHAFGARVVLNPKGMEVGTQQIELTAEGRADPLFEGCATPIGFHETHEDMVVDLPPSVRVLARNEWTPVQAIAVGACARGVQFHPEMEEAALRAFVALRGGGPSSVGPAPGGPRLLRAFLERLGRKGLC
ncbi:MAG: glutamine amidotransferase [Deltaproteobacteria bacterium]|nr:glutamine amidotransferase [Deltaproteobacteria bacterium]